MSTIFSPPVSSTRSRSRLHEFVAAALREAKNGLWRDRWLYAVVALHGLICICLLSISGFQRAFAFDGYFVIWPAIFLFFFPVLLVLGLTLQIVHRTERRRMLAFYHVFSPSRVGRLAAGAALLLAFMIFEGSFTSIKNAAPLMHGGFPFDELHANLDRWLHLGRDPWRLLHAWDWNGVLLHAVEWNYAQGWFAFCFGTLFLVAVLPEADGVRTRYMLCYLAVWIFVGNVLAGIFLSAGPAFYGEVTGDTARFGELVSALHASNSTFSAASMQATLWRLYLNGESGLGSGIAAFPSVHVALITLNALFLREWKPRVAIVGFGYAGLILLSSVFLGWHYAIDGYVGAAAAITIYVAFRRAGSKLTTATAGATAGCQSLERPSHDHRSDDPFRQMRRRSEAS